MNNLIGKNNALEDTLRNTTHSLEHERSHNALTMSQTVTELRELKEKYHYKVMDQLLLLKSVFQFVLDLDCFTDPKFVI